MPHTDANSRIIPQSVHGIDRSAVSANAIAVVDRLKSAGFTAEVVGGSVRDLLAGRRPKDFDVATSARPEQVRTLFRRCEVFGRRFQIAEVRVKRECIQVATYRRAPNHSRRFRRSKNISANGKILKDNLFGNIKEDAFRRDLTINSLYLHPSDMRVIDYTGGYEDARNGIVRVIGSPAERFREDPVRMLRAVRFASLPDFEFDAATEREIAPNARFLADVSKFRLIDELSKILFNGRAQASFEHLHRLEIFQILFPPYHWLHSGLPDNHGLVDWMRLLLAETDERIQSDHHTSVAFTFAAILWPKFNDAISKRSKRRRPAYFRIAQGILSQQSERTFLSGIIRHRVEDIWLLQRQLESGISKSNASLATHRSFRSAVRLLELRSTFGEVEESSCRAWVELRDRQEGQSQPRRTRRRRRARWR